MKRWQRLKIVLLNYDTEPTEIGLSLVAILWGIVLLLPDNPIFRQPNFADLARHVPQPIAAVFLVCYGSLRAWAVFANRVPIRRYATFVGVLLWGYHSALMWTYGIYGPSAAVLPVCTAGCVWIYWRLSRLVHEGKEEHDVVRTDA